MTDPFYKDGLEFSCRRCSRCCRHEPGYVYLSEADLSGLCLRLRTTADDFVRRYCRWVPYHDGGEVLCLAEKRNFDCVLWEGKCTAYEARPVQCSTYPFWPFIAGSERSWREESRECPGIGRGELRSREHIDLCMDSYRRNRPIRRPRED